MWIKRTHGLSRKPEVLALAGALKIHRIYAAGLCEEFWEWVDQSADPGSTNGDAFIRLPGLDPAAMIDGLVDFPGFYAALETVGWVRFEIDTGVLVIPAWDRHNSSTAKVRALGASRAQRYRIDNKGLTERNAPVTHERDAGVTVRNAPVTRGALQEQRRTEETESAANTALGCAAHTVPLDAAAGTLTEGEVAECIACARKRIGGDADAAIRAGPLVMLGSLGCDRSFVDAVRRHASDNGNVAEAFWPAMLEYARMQRRPHKPGGWWREALARNGLDVRK